MKALLLCVAIFVMFVYVITTASDAKTGEDFARCRAAGGEPTSLAKGVLCLKPGSLIVPDQTK